jgi:hypothetical protein
VSHAPERKEKDCLNCGTIIHGRYCHICGQENRVPRERFWSMVVHFFNDITHFDGKFFTSMKWLLRRPGFLSTEYVSGRRARYLHPIRMYVFTSAVFFLIFFSLFNIEKISIGLSGNENKLSKTIDDLSNEAYKNAKTREDSLTVARAISLIRVPAEEAQDSTGRRPRIGISFGNAARKYNTIAAYDSAQKAGSPSDRDGWLLTRLNHRAISLQQKYGEDRRKFLEDLLERFIHSFPYMLFVSLPLYALLLKLLYARRKKFYYADHIIFLVHLYIFTFLLLLLYFGFDRLQTLTGLGLWNYLKLALAAAGIYYAFSAMKNFYGQETGKTLLKFAILNVLCLIFLVFIFGVFFVFSFYRI